MSEQVFCAQLPNHLRIICQPIPWLHTVVVGIFISVGTQDEAKGEEGIAHFLEHVLFKGTHRRTGRQIGRIIDTLGGNIDAFTEKELTCFYLRVLPEHLPQGLSLLKELLTEPALRPKDIEIEKSIVLAEIQSVEDTPEDLVGELFFEALWNGHPLSRPVLGTKQSVSHFHSAMLLHFLRRHYTPNRMVIAAAGAIEPRRLQELVAKTLGEMKAQVGTDDQIPPPQPKPTLRLTQRQTEHFYFCFGSHGFPAGQPEHYPAALLDIIIGGGVSSRLFTEVREKRGLAYAISSLSAAFKKAGFFFINGSCAPKDAEKLTKVVVGELQRIKRCGLRNGELERAKTQLKLSIVMNQESVTGTMMRLGRQMHYFGRPIPIDELLLRTDKVSEDEVLEIARNLLDGSNFAASFIGPITDAEGERLLTILNEV